ncbi:MAG: N-acetylmuramoyl-L-alanine amidase [Vicinamibacterales bacterium]
MFPVRAISAAVLAVVLLAGAGGDLTQPTPPPPYTVLSREERRPLPTRVLNGQEMFAVDDLARLFGLAAREDTIAGGLTITVRGQSILLSPSQELVSVAGRLISLPTPPVKEGNAWFVPVDFVSRALAPVAGTRIELRKASRLVLSGDIRVPRIAGRIESQGPSLARLTLDVAPATPHSVTQDASRLMIRFEADLLDVSLPSTTAPDLIQNMRVEGTAVVVELGGRFGSFRTSDLPGDRGATRIVIEVTAETTESPAAPPPPAQEAPPLLELTPSGGLRSVVIDAGHGGAEEGARGRDGISEKTVTMSVARRLKAALEARLGVRVILTRDGDTAVALDQRASVANNNKADLFISLHANASVRPAVAGAEVFYLSLDEYGEGALRASTAPRETLPVLGGGSRDIEVVEWQFAQARHISQSAALARNVETALRARVAMSPRALQQAPFRVLVGANMPAVLVEMGFLSNAAQARQLASDQYQSTIVEALVDAIVRFRDAGGAPGAAAPRGDR